LQIVVLDRQSGLVVPVVTLKNLAANGRVLNPVTDFLEVTADLNITALDSMWVCPGSNCQFGENRDSVIYSFTLSAPKMNDTTVSVVSKYAQYYINQKKCIHEYRGGVRDTLYMNEKLP
jgi:hypothetical protein